MHLRFGSTSQPRAAAPPSIYPLVVVIALAAILCLKLKASSGFRVDTDETQHAHVVWGWATGRLQYRDLFDNHMPLFHILCAPYFALFGQDAGILFPLRLAMLPLYGLSLWCVFRLADLLFCRRAAWWCCLLAALLPAYFFTSTEFRADDLWAVFWFFSVVTAISGQFTPRRAFLVGLLLGLAFAASIKTVFLGVALAFAAAFALGLRAFIGREPIRWKQLLLMLLAILCGGIVFPGAIALYFAARGAFGDFFYCVFRHNMVPHLKRWGDSPLIFLVFPLSLPFIGAYAFYVFRQAPGVDLATRRVLVMLTPFLYGALMFSYCPDLSRQDNLPYMPLLPMMLIPLLLSIDRRWPRPRLAAAFLSYMLPAFLLTEAILTWRMHDLDGSGLLRLRHEINTVLTLTGKSDYVMDDKGDYIFRNRPFYWVFEPVTRTRIKLGWITDDIPARLEQTGAPLCQLCPTRPGTDSAKFIVGNYMPFDPSEADIGVLGKVIGAPKPGESCQFQVQIAASYVMLSETGKTEGKLDGAQYHGLIRLNRGPHWFQRDSGGGRLAIFLGSAAENGYSPMFDEADNLIHEMNDHKSRRE